MRDGIRAEARPSGAPPPIPFGNGEGEGVLCIVPRPGPSAVDGDAFPFVPFVLDKTKEKKRIPCALICS